jgi:hypothetical protein
MVLLPKDRAAAFFLQQPATGIQNLRTHDQGIAPCCLLNLIVVCITPQLSMRSF